MWPKLKPELRAAILAIVASTSQPRTVSVTWKELGLEGGQGVHDLWRQKDLGLKTFGFAEEIPPHGVALLRVQAQP